MKKYLLIAFLLCSLSAFAQPTLQDTTRFTVFDPVKSWVPNMGNLKAYMFPSQTGNNGKVLQTDGSVMSWQTQSGGVSDGDKGDIVVTSSGAVWSVDNSVISDANISDVSLSKISSGTFTSTIDGTLLASSGFFRIKYNNNSPGLAILEGAGSVSIYDATNTNYISANSTDVRIGSGTHNMMYLGGVLRLYDSDGTNYIGLKSPLTSNLTADYTLTLPVNDGDANQVLTTDGTGGLSWTTVSGSGSVATDAIWDAKGDLAVGTGANTAAKLNVGTDGQTLYADASQSTGLRWGPSIISPAQITSDQDNYSPTDWAKCSVLRISGDNGIRAVTSLAATFSGDEKTIINVGSFPLYFPSEHPDGTAANRFTGHRDYVLKPGGACRIYYDGTSSRWRVLTDNDILTYGRVLHYWAVPGTVTSGDWGHMVFLTSLGSVSTINPASGYPVAVALSTSNAANGIAAVGFPETSTSIAFAGDAHVFYEALVSIPTLSDGTQTFQCNVGFVTSGLSATVDVANMAAFRYSHSINGGNWQILTRDGLGNESNADSGITVAAATLYLLRVEIDKSRTEARFYIDGAYVGRLTTNLPAASGVGGRCLIGKSVGTTARTFNVHKKTYVAIYP